VQSQDSPRIVNITVAIPAHNEASSIGRVLESVCGDSYDRHLLREVLVYDDASTDETARIVENVAARFPVVRLIRGQRRVGCATGVELLFQSATGDVIVRVNADVWLERGAIELLCDPIAAGAGIAIAAHVPIVARGSVAALAASFSHEVVEGLKNGPHRQHYAVGHFCSYSREAVRGMVFPPDLINDDHFTSITIARAGGRIVYVPEARCRIKLPATAGDYWRVSRRILEGERQLRDRYGMRPAPLHVVLGAVFLTALRKPVPAACWAPMYLWSSSRPTPTRDSAWPSALSTKSHIE
jgi:cellulose synthase/poly-beta-1,6-N-acetylglucosamine synthase-like glycosyltransferase